MADPKDRTYDPPFSGTFTLFPNNAVAVDVSGGDVTFTQARTIYAGGAGNVAATPWGGGSDITVTVPAGGVVPVRVRVVKQSGTTATALLSVY